MTADSPFTDDHFARDDDSADPLFYAEPRLLVHIDDLAIEAVSRTYGELLPKGGAILDLMASYRSHMPRELGWSRLAGLGLNEVELRENPQLTDFAVHDLNADPHLPYGDAEFDGAVCTVSAQYMTRPVDVFRDIARVLRPGAPFVLTYSNRMFPTKAVAAWKALDDRERASLIAAYFRESSCFGEVKARDCTLRQAGSAYQDPLYAVWALRLR